MLHDTERNRLFNELRRLKLAAADMRLVIEATEALTSDRFAPSPRVLETGLVTAYARSFNSSGRGWQRFRDQYTPTDPNERAVHDAILKRRNKAHAHTDERESGRDIVDVFGSHTYSEEYERLTLEALVKIRTLAQVMFDRFDAAATELEHELGRPRAVGSVDISDHLLDGH